MIYLYIDSLDFFSKFCQKNFWLVRTIVLSKFQRTLPLIGAPCGNLTRFGSFFSLDLLKSKGRPLSYTFLCLSSFFFIFFSIFFKIALPTPKPVNTQMPPNFIVKRPRIKPPPPQQVKIFFFFFFIPPHTIFLLDSSLANRQNEQTFFEFHRLLLICKKHFSHYSAPPQFSFSRL